MSQFLLAIDQGTTGTTVLVLDVTKPTVPKIIGQSTKTFPQHYPQPGWVSHDLQEVWQSVELAAREALQKAENCQGFSAKLIIAMGITNQRETLCIFDRTTAAPQGKAIVWQCKRSHSICSDLKTRGYESQFRHKTGLLLDPYFTGSKMSWIMKHEPTTARLLQTGKCVWGTIDSFLLHRLTGAQVFATEASNASRTLLYDIHKCQYDLELAEILKVPSISSLAEIKDSAGVFGTTKGLSFLPDGIPISGILGDQQAALAGQTCFQPGEAKCTYGTGAFLVVNTGAKAATPPTGLLSSLAWTIAGKPTYMLEGATFVAGAGVQFIRDELQFVSHANQTEAAAVKQIAAPNLYFVPSLAGLGAPHWNPGARGAFLGMSRDTTKEQLTRACLEGIVFQVNDLIDTMNAGSDTPIKRLFVDGGAAANNLMMGMQADFSQIIIDRPSILETTCMGAAMFAGLGIKLYQNLDEMKNVRISEAEFHPDHPDGKMAAREACLLGWKRAVKAVQVFAGDS